MKGVWEEIWRIFSFQPPGPFYNPRGPRTPQKKTKCSRPKIRDSPKNLHDYQILGVCLNMWQFRTTQGRFGGETGPLTKNVCIQGWRCKIRCRYIGGTPLYSCTVFISVSFVHERFSNSLRFLLTIGPEFFVNCQIYIICILSLLVFVSCHMVGPPEPPGCLVQLGSRDVWYN